MKHALMLFVTAFVFGLIPSSVTSIMAISPGEPWLWPVVAGATVLALTVCACDAVMRRGEGK